MCYPAGSVLADGPVVDAEQVADSAQRVTRCEAAVIGDAGRRVVRVSGA